MTFFIIRFSAPSHYALLHSTHLASPDTERHIQQSTTRTRREMEDEMRAKPVESEWNPSEQPRTTASTPASCACNPKNSGVPSEYTYY